MKEKPKAIFGHLVFAALFCLGFAITTIHSDAFMLYLSIFFTGIGLWAALGTPRSHWFSFSFSAILWLVIGAIITYIVMSPYANHSEGEVYYYVLTYVLAVAIMSMGFALGRIGIAIVQSFSKQNKPHLGDQTTPTLQ